MVIGTDFIPKEYITSTYEMNRRKQAFITLSSSVFLSICAFSMDVVRSSPGIFVPILLVFALLLLLLIIRLNKTHDNQSFLKVCLSEHELEWKFKGTSRTCLYSDITSLRIKRTTRGSIREIRIGTCISGMKLLYINGLEDFEGFVDDLLRRMEHVKITKYNEPIDFDHPLYYVFFGTAVGIATTWMARMIPLLSVTGLKKLQLAIACFLMIAGIVFILNRPVRGRYGNQSAFADWLFGISFLAIGAIILISYDLLFIL